MKNSVFRRIAFLFLALQLSSALAAEPVRIAFIAPPSRSPTTMMATRADGPISKTAGSDAYLRLRLICDLFTRPDGEANDGNSIQANADHCEHLAGAHNGGAGKSE